MFDVKIIFYILGVDYYKISAALADAQDTRLYRIGVDTDRLDRIIRWPKKSVKTTP